MTIIFSTVAGFLSVGGYFPYIHSILRGKTKPMKTSWVIWGTLDAIATVGMYQKHALNGQIIGAVIGAWMVVILSFRFGKSGWSRLDVFCLFGACLGMFLWWLFDAPTLGILISVGMIFLGSLPTFASAWEFPDRENRTGWTLHFLSGIAAILAVSRWTLANAAQPVAFTLIEAIMMYLLYVRPLNRSKTVFI